MGYFRRLVNCLTLNSGRGDAELLVLLVELDRFAFTGSGHGNSHRDESEDGSSLHFESLALEFDVSKGVNVVELMRFVAL